MATVAALTEAGTSKTVQAGGTTIHYHEAGQGEPLFLLPSFGPTNTAWINYHRNLPFLSQHFRCIAMDLANHGRTGPVVTGEQGHDLQARMLLSLMDALGIEKADLVGNSVGGTTVLKFGLYHPERVRKIIFGGCHPPTGDENPDVFASSVDDYRKLVREALSDPSPDAFRRFLQATFYNQSLVTDELVNYFYRHFISHPEHAAARKQGGGVSPHILHLRDVKMPVLLIWGRQDKMCPIEHGLIMTAGIRDSRLLILNQCGSWPSYEQPAEYNTQVLNFLKHDFVRMDG